MEEIVHIEVQQRADWMRYATADGQRGWQERKGQRKIQAQLRWLRTLSRLKQKAYYKMLRCIHR